MRASTSAFFSAVTLRRADDKGADKLEKFAHFLEPQNKEQLSASKLKMLRAGYRSKHAVRIFHAFQFLGGVLGLGGGVLYLSGMLIMAWNVFMTVKGGKAVEQRVPLVAAHA